MKKLATPTRHLTGAVHLSHFDYKTFKVLRNGSLTHFSPMCLRLSILSRTKKQGYPCFFVFVPGERIELSWITPHDFESCASTNSAIPALLKYTVYFKQLKPGCRPLTPSHRKQSSLLSVHPGNRKQFT